MTGTRGRDIIVVGASAGGVETLTALVRQLPADLPAAVFIILHISQYGTSVLPSILSRKSALPAHHPEDGESIVPGRIYVAPSDRHLVIEGERVRVIRGPRENGHRPSIDPLFRSAARSVGPRAVGVVLSGLLDDGTAGLLAIKRSGGLAIVQSPDEALFNGMVNSAIENVAVDHVLPVAGIAALLPPIARGEADPYSVRDVSESVTTMSTNKSAAAPTAAENSTDTTDTDREIGSTLMSREQMDASNHPGITSSFSCPDCGGVLWEIQDGELVRYRCRTGHAYSSGTLLAEQSAGLDTALWTALRALEESASLARRLSDRAREHGHHISETRFAAQADEALARAEIIRRVLLRPEPEMEGNGFPVP